jgi:hypothetical protein
MTPLDNCTGKHGGGVINRRAFLTDSDSKWAWREANCRDAACLGASYATRIGELQRLIESMRTGTLDGPDVPAEPGTQRKAVMPARQQTETAMLRCTAANPGIVVNDQRSIVINGERRPVEISATRRRLVLRTGDACAGGGRLGTVRLACLCLPAVLDFTF